MPSIKIKEIDTTSPGVVLTTQDVVYIPGFVNAEYIENDGVIDAFIPTLCTSVAEFESYFGSKPAVFTEDQPYTNFASNAIPPITGVEDTAIMFKAGSVDLNYIYAKELLNSGISVLYERVNNLASEISVNYMYSILTQTNIYSQKIWENLKDINEYNELKYLTSGCYPTFEYNGTSPISWQMDSISVSIDDATYLSKIKTEQITTFKYGSIYQIASAMPPVETFTDLAMYIDSALPEELYLVKDTQTTYKINISGHEADVYVESKAELDTYPLDDLKANDIARVQKDESLENKITYYKLKKDGDSLVWQFLDEEIRTWDVEAVNWDLYINNAEEPSLTNVSLKDYGISINTEQRGDVTTNIGPYKLGAFIKVDSTKKHSSVIVAAMLNCAASRGDCVALIDHTNNPARILDPVSTASVYYQISNISSSYRINNNGEFGAMFTPWCDTNLVTLGVVESMPGSFIYLKALAQSVRVNANWLAIAGASRGIADIAKPNLNNNRRLSNTVADSYQPREDIAINPITNVKPYGYLIWGNRTLKNNAIEGNLTATSFLNTRNMVSDVKKMAYIAAKRCMFEQNSDILWINYKAMITPLLDNMVAGEGLTGYKLIKQQTTEKAKLVCTIRLYPIYAVESFDITVELADDEVTIS